MDAESQDWSSWEPVSLARGSSLAKRLRFEINEGHQLFEVVPDLVVVAADGASDDILAVLLGSPDTFYIVHPTWSRVPESNLGLPGFWVVKNEEVPNELFQA